MWAPSASQRNLVIFKFPIKRDLFHLFVIFRKLPKMKFLYTVSLALVTVINAVPVPENDGTDLSYLAPKEDFPTKFVWVESNPLLDELRGLDEDKDVLVNRGELNGTWVMRCNLGRPKTCRKVFVPKTPKA